MQKYVETIDDELHHCTRQLQQLGASINLHEHKALGAVVPISATYIAPNHYQIQILDHAVNVQRNTEKMVEVDEEKFKRIFEMKAFIEWCNGLDPTIFQRCDFTRIWINNIDFFGPRVGFLEFNAEVLYENRPLSGITFMRGGAVGILVVFTCEGQKYVLATVQPRIPAGKFTFTEIPAGMIDADENFAGVAAKEIKEETGLSIKASDLVDLIDAAGLHYDNVQGLYPSVGGCDEFLRYYYYHMEVSRDFLTELEGKCTGVLEEGEMIKLAVIPFDRFPEVSPDMKTMTALYLYSRLGAKSQQATPGRARPLRPLPRRRETGI